MRKSLYSLFWLVGALFFVSFTKAAPSFGDEGMWTLNAFPTQKVKDKYRFDASAAWLGHVMLSSARLAGGCSGSFVSRNGLVMTNHHCAHPCIEQLSKAGRDYVSSGFYAKSQEEEARCPEIEVDRLLEISDVTEPLRQATANLEGKAYNDAQKSAMSKLEKDCTQGSDTVRCDVVTLYHGGKFNLYKYHRYQDVRLVFAPEKATAFFGGDPDNFMFPRYDFDISFLRVYENGKPMVNGDFFKWSNESANAGDLTFVTGHPGHTSRLLTISQLEFSRDVQIYSSLLNLSEMRGILTQFGSQSPEARRISEDKLFGVENSLKAFKGREQTLMDPNFFAKKRAKEAELRRKINRNPKWKKAYGSAWDAIAKAENSLKAIYAPLTYIENGRGFQSRLYTLAKTLVRASSELTKPNGKRYREFADSNLPHVKQDLFSEAPIYDDLEITTLTFSLTKLREALTADDPFIKRLFGPRSPAEIAEAAVKGSKLQDVKLRRALFEGGSAAIEGSHDPMIELARMVDPEARALRDKFESEIEPILKKNSEKVAQAQFAAFGTDTYPDATFTLRISYGQILGYNENGHEVAPLTQLGGAYDRHTGREPFALPESWLQAKPKLDLKTPFNFCSTNDIIGGNSGSPVVNKDAEIVGLIFDGNIQSLGGDFGYDESVNRAVAVHSAGIIELLQKVYGADRIVAELKGGTKSTP